MSAGGFPSDARRSRWTATPPSHLPVSARRREQHRPSEEFRTRHATALPSCFAVRELRCTSQSVRIYRPRHPQFRIRDDAWLPHEAESPFRRSNLSSQRYHNATGNSWQVPDDTPGPQVRTGFRTLFERIRPGAAPKLGHGPPSSSSDLFRLATHGSAHATTYPRSSEVRPGL